MKAQNVVFFEPQNVRGQVKMILTERPQMIFDKIIDISINKKDMELWIHFLEECSNLTKTNYMKISEEKRKTKDKTKQGLLEIERRSLGLANAILINFLEKIKLWKTHQAKKNLRISLNYLDCFYIPSYLQTYGTLNQEYLQTTLKYVDCIFIKLLDIDQIEKITELIDEYVENLNIYTAR